MATTIHPPILNFQPLTWIQRITKVLKRKTQQRTTLPPSSKLLKLGVLMRTVVESAKRKSKKGVDLEALSRHGYKGGLSVLNVPPPSEPEDQKQDWSWSKGQETRVKETQESYADRQKTRAAILEGEQLAYARTQREKKELSFSQKEKRKRDLGQASRGKNYVEEEKRLLRDSGFYSGFDS